MSSTLTSNRRLPVLGSYLGYISCLNASASWIRSSPSSLFRNPSSWSRSWSLCYRALSRALLALNYASAFSGSSTRWRAMHFSSINLLQVSTLSISCAPCYRFHKCRSYWKLCSNSLSFSCHSRRPRSLNRSTWASRGASLFIFSITLLGC